MERNSGGAYEVKDAKEDYRGHLVLVDELNGEVLGAVGGQAPVSADPTLSDRESVLIDVGRSGELDARTVFVQKIPTDEHTYLTRGASMLSYGISGAANIIASGMTGASRMYVARASPHPSADPKTPPEQRAPPPRAVTWMTSAGARKGMGQAQTATGKAVQISGKTVAAVEGFVRRTAQQVARAGTKNLDFEPKDKGKQRGEYHPVAYSPGPYLSTSPTQSVATLPPAYSEKPALPPRGPPLPPRTEKGAPPGSPGPSKSAPGSPTMGSQRLRTRDKVVASAELIFSTLDQSTKRLLDVGSEAISTAVGHKYGAEAGHSTRLMTGTVRNVGLIYVDIKGLGHRALLKTAGVEIVKTRMKDGREVKLKTDAGGVVLDAQVEAPQKR